MNLILNQLRIDEVAWSGGIEMANLDPDARFPWISTDTRRITQGDWFLALRGENFDGHQFCDYALEAGAAGLIVDREWTPPAELAGLPRLVVQDTLTAYGDIAAAVRRLWGGPVLAISGSAGKTTTRRLVASALSHVCNTLEPEKNFNNLIGLPHTLLRLRPDHEVAVLELGMNQPGELRRLAEIAGPSAALLTNIGSAHIGMFRDQAELTAAKLDLFHGCAPGTPLAANASCPNTVGAMGALRGQHPVTWFCAEAAPLDEIEPAIRIVEVEPLTPVGYGFTLDRAGRVSDWMDLRIFGRQQLENVVAASALLLAAGRDPALIDRALAGFRSEPHRGELVETGGMTLILDCYNAAPSGMLRALESLGEMTAPRIVAVLGDMRELGGYARAAHDALLPVLRRIPNLVLHGLGPECSRLARLLADEGIEAHAHEENRLALEQQLKATLREGDVVLFKGAHYFALEKIAHAIAPQAGIL